MKSSKRHIERFPRDFYFQLDEDELKFLRFQNGTLELKQGQYSKYRPHVFTEQGVAMLATILRTENASKVSVKIMRTFVAMRKFINENKEMFKRLTLTEYKLLENDNQINELFDHYVNKKNRKDLKI